MTFKIPYDAFQAAIASGRLTKLSAGEYMYMGTTEAGKDLFKNIISREYLA